LPDPDGAGVGPGDPRFFARPGLRSPAELADHVGGTLLPASDGTTTPVLRGVAPLSAAAPDQVSFLDNRKYLSELAITRAGLVIVSQAHAERRPPSVAALVVPDPYLAWARIASLFYPPVPARPGRHASAVVEDGAEIDPTAEIGALAVIGAGVRVGAHTRIGEGAVIGPGVVIGRDCRIGPLVSITHAILGDRVQLLAGARIGQEGFGFAIGAEGFTSVPQLGRVVLEHDVEIGANSTIDRGSTADTVIGAGSRLDNLVQIGHNVRLGRCCVVVAQAGISGSTILEDFVTVAAQAGLTGHLRIGSKARIGAQAGVMSDVEAGTDIVGSPAMAVREFFRNVATLRRLSRRPNTQT
jgi:UDP-3-O-[3-hydroxymyristoyl] glucosamine N-acyltransferase